MDYDLPYLPLVLRHLISLPAAVAQLDARPPSDQEVAGSTPTGLALFFRGDES